MLENLFMWECAQVKPISQLGKVAWWYLSANSNNTSVVYTFSSPVYVNQEIIVHDLLHLSARTMVLNFQNVYNDTSVFVPWSCWKAFTSHLAEGFIQSDSQVRNTLGSNAEFSVSPKRTFWYVNWGPFQWTMTTANHNAVVFPLDRKFVSTSSQLLCLSVMRTTHFSATTLRLTVECSTIDCKLLEELSRDP